MNETIATWIFRIPKISRKKISILTSYKLRISLGHTSKRTRSENPHFLGSMYVCILFTYMFHKCKENIKEQHQQQVTDHRFFESLGIFQRFCDGDVQTLPIFGICTDLVKKWCSFATFTNLGALKKCIPAFIGMFFSSDIDIDTVSTNQMFHRSTPSIHQKISHCRGIAFRVRVRKGTSRRRWGLSRFFSPKRQ